MPCTRTIQEKITLGDYKTQSVKKVSIVSVVTVLSVMTVILVLFKKGKKGRGYCNEGSTHTQELNEKLQVAVEKG